MVVEDARSSCGRRSNDHATHVVVRSKQAPRPRLWWGLVQVVSIVAVVLIGVADGTGGGGGSGRELQFTHAEAAEVSEGQGDDSRQGFPSSYSSAFTGSNRTEPTTKCEKAGFHPWSFENDEYLRQQQWDGDRPRWPGKKGLKGSPTCKSATTNARGTYTSHQSPCTFTFHVAPNAPPPKANSLSNACTNANLHPDDPAAPSGENPTEQYVVLWPDECVGTYARCYRTVEDEKIMLRFLCKHTDFNIPDGTTHVRVDCTANEKAQMDVDAEGNGTDDAKRHEDPYLRHQAQRQREMLAALFVVLAVCLVAGCCCIVGAYRYAIQPYLATMLSLKRSRSDPELSKLVAMGSGGGGDDRHPTQKREPES